MSYWDVNWYPMILVGRTGSEEPREKVLGKSKITKQVEAESQITKEVRVPSKVIP